MTEPERCTVAHPCGPTVAYYAPPNKALQAMRYRARLSRIVRLPA